MSLPPVTLYSMNRRVKKPDAFDFDAYMERIRKATKTPPDVPCHKQPNRCSGCPTPRDGELCWEYRKELER